MTVFRFLHISDLHYHNSKEASSGIVTRDELLTKIDEACNRQVVNCLIISGDIFFHGVLRADDSADLIKYINSLPGKDNLVVVPGNHDRLYVNSWGEI